MSIFHYKLPSGAAFTLTAPNGTTQAVADDIFYKQVAAGTFVDFNPGDSVTSASQTLTNFGLSRLFRTTAGVDEKTVLAAIAGLPLVVTMPTNLNNTPITTRINTADYIGVTGNYSLPPTSVGPLKPKQVQASMALVATRVNQPYDEVSTDGVGKYGLSCDQLERAGYVKPGYCKRYCSADNFVDFMNSPSVWTGLDGVDSVDQILASPARQNRIQEKLMNIGYDQLVQAGVIKPPPTRVSVPSISIGHVYNSCGELVATNTVNLLLSSECGRRTFPDEIANSPCAIELSEHMLGKITTPVSSLGTTAVADYSTGLESLSSGAVRFVDNTQVSSLATSDAAVEQVAISNSLSEDIGALVVNTSKFGLETTLTWIHTGNTETGEFVYSLSGSPYINYQITSAGAAPEIPSIEVLQQLTYYGKDTQSSINFANNNLAGSVSGVQPAAAFTGTTNRNSIDAATVRIIGSDKVPPPIYQTPSIQSLGVQADINLARDKLQVSGGGKDIDGRQNYQLL